MGYEDNYDKIKSQEAIDRLCKLYLATSGKTITEWFNDHFIISKNSYEQVKQYKIFFKESINDDKRYYISTDYAYEREVERLYERIYYDIKHINTEKEQFEVLCEIINVFYTQYIVKLLGSKRSNYINPQFHEILLEYAMVRGFYYPPGNKAIDTVLNDLRLNEIKPFSSQSEVDEMFIQLLIEYMDTHHIEYVEILYSKEDLAEKELNSLKYEYGAEKIMELINKHRTELES